MGSTHMSSLAMPQSTEAGKALPSPSARRLTSSNNNLDWRNPLAEFGLREACETSILNVPYGSVPSATPHSKRRLRI